MPDKRVYDLFDRLAEKAAKKSAESWLLVTDGDLELVESVLECQKMTLNPTVTEKTYIFAFLSLGIQSELVVTVTANEHGCRKVMVEHKHEERTVYAILPRQSTSRLVSLPLPGEYLKPSHREMIENLSEEECAWVIDIIVEEAVELDETERNKLRRWLYLLFVDDIDELITYQRLPGLKADFNADPRPLPMPEPRR